MGLNKNNNRRLLFRIAKNNLLTKNLSSLFSALSILLAVVLVSTLSLYLVGYQFAEQQILDKMQHVIYLNVTADLAEELGNDERIDISIPYKYNDTDFQTGDVSYHFTFFGSHDGPIETYQLAEGAAPQKYNEIAADKAFLEALKKESAGGLAADSKPTPDSDSAADLKPTPDSDSSADSKPASGSDSALDSETTNLLGSTVTLDTGNGTEDFIITGLTENAQTPSSYSIYVSREFAETSGVMAQIPFDALVRLRDMEGMPYSAFTTLVYQIAADYGIERPNVNTNGKFEESLQRGNSGLLVVLFAAFLLFFAGGLVIYSIFYFSVMSRVRQIGQFQTIGMTPLQVRKMIRREGWLLCGISIPLGLLLSGIIAYFLLPEGWNLKNYGTVCLLVTAAACLIVQFSISRPAAAAAKISPVDAAKTTGSDREYSGRSKKRGRHADAANAAAPWQTVSPAQITSRPRRPLSPCTLARLEGQSSRKKWWLTTASLAFGGILFMVASSWNASWDEEAFSRDGDFQKGEYVLSYLYSHTAPKTYGITDMQLTGHLSKDLERRIRQIPHVKDVLTTHSVSGVVELDGLTFSLSFYPITKEDSEYFGLDAQGNNTYEYLAGHDAVLVTKPDLYETLTGAEFEPGKILTVRYFDGEEHTAELEIAAVTSESVKSPLNAPDEFCIADVTVEKLWKDMNTANRFTISAEDYEAYGLQIEEDLKELIAGYDDLSLFTLREKILEDSGNIRSYQTQIYGLSLFVILFSIFNLLNTLISSFAARKKELSMLESVGMEQKQLHRMLLWESFFLALPNLAFTLTAGSLAGYGFVRYMQRSAGYLHYHFPAAAVLLYIGAMFLLPMLVSFLCLKSQDKTALVERIRYQD